MNSSYMSKSLVKLSHAWIQEFCQEVGEPMPDRQNILPIVIFSPQLI